LGGGEDFNESDGEPMKVAIGPAPMKIFELISGAYASAVPGAKFAWEAPRYETWERASLLTGVSWN